MTLNSLVYKYNNMYLTFSYRRIFGWFSNINNATHNISVPKSISEFWIISLGKIFKNHSRRLSNYCFKEYEHLVGSWYNYKLPCSKPLLKESFKNFPETLLCPYSQLLLDPGCLELEYRTLSPVSRPLANGLRSHSPL